MLIPRVIVGVGDFGPDDFDDASAGVRPTRNRLTNLFTCRGPRFADNNSVDFRNGWDEEPAKLVERLFGADPQSRWKPAEDVYRSAVANSQFLLIDGFGHDRKRLQRYSTDFFSKALAE